jgi:hypothetical protein
MQLWSAEEYRTGFERAGFGHVEQAFFNIPHDPQSRISNPGTLATWGVKPV